MKVIRMSRIMAVLTAVFMPLTLISGWESMTFVHIPELSRRYSYPAVCCVCLLIFFGGPGFTKRRGCKMPDPAATSFPHKNDLKACKTL